jgi:aspartate dehydrogenase
MAASRIGLIGYGSIGSEVARLLGEQAQHPVILCGVLARPDGPTAQRLNHSAVPLFTGIPSLLQTQPDIVVECAGHTAVDAYGEQVLDAGCNLMLVSAGSLALAARLDRLKSAAERNARRIFIPSGAVGGLDILQAARIAGLHSVRYRSRKPPAAWLGTLAEESVDLAKLGSAHTFYRGNARMAAMDFPKNANVAATVALATLGLDQTEVELAADPDADGNYHEIEATGVTGTVFIRIKSAASPGNPRTSAIVAYSVVHTLLHGRDTVVL